VENIVAYRLQELEEDVEGEEEIKKKYENFINVRKD